MENMILTQLADMLASDSIIKRLMDNHLLLSDQPIYKSNVAPVVQTSQIINSIPPQGILINSPGKYEFANDITWEPSLPHSVAICIMADNVLLDLKDFSLTANISDESQQLYGILLAPNMDEIALGDGALQNITIQNGTLNGITYQGISVLKSANVNGLKISNMTIENMRYTETSKPCLTPCGIFISSCNNVSIAKCTVQNLEVTTPSCAGIQLIDSANGKIQGCVIKNLVNHDGAVQGFSYIGCANLITVQCTTQAFQTHFKGSTITSGHTAIGYIPIFCTALTFNDCSAANITGCCDDAHGMSIFLDAGVVVNRFSAKEITDGVSPYNTGAKATGLEVYGIAVEINDSTVEEIKAIVPQDLQAAGFSAWGNNIVFNNCTAKDVQVTDAQQKPSTAYGYGTGFGWAPDPRPEFNAQPANMVQYNNCNSINCQVGFDTWFHTNSIWKNPTTANCPIFILVQPHAKRVLSMNKCSESPDGQEQKVTLINMAKNNNYPKIHTE